MKDVNKISIMIIILMELKNVGVLKKLMGEDHNDYEIMTGVSVGALNVASG